MLKDTTAITAQLEAFRMGVEHLMTLFPVEKRFSVCCRKWK